ncbi:3-hydroxyacyl-CoA dehyrogenase [Thozetella sp. PMI_491]|nr:3-hydroxyacyl-CoA dehyrogenase [Thozetella sp. PMI_491]
MSAVKTIGILGTGVIGASWTTLFLARSYRVIVSDPAPGAKERLDDYIQQQWPLMERIGLAPNADPRGYRWVDELADHLDGVDFIQENGPENIDLKTTLFSKLDSRAEPNVVIASSSSGIPSSRFIGKCTKAPGRILIGHPFNPPHLMPLVEVVPHPGADAGPISTAMELYTKLGKSPILVKKEIPGHIANRLQAALNMEALSLVKEGVVSAKDVDLAVTSSLGMRWAANGPFMTNILGGGGGRDGFLKLQKTIGRSAIAWKEDMEKHQFDMSDESLEKVDTSVQEWIDEGIDLVKVAKLRDDIILTVMEEKSKLGETL